MFASGILGGDPNLRFIVTSRFGKVLIAVRDAESRTRFIGYRPERYKLFVFVLSAAMAGMVSAPARASTESRVR